jgi:hypothetical protein
MPRRIAFPTILAVSAVSLVGYLWICLSTLRLGLPLDDAWIHQTYARNLVQLGEWAFIPGEPSAGSTAPLWTALLALTRALGLGPVGGAFALGTLALALAAWVCMKWLGFRLADAEAAGFGAAILVALEWHMVWAGLSGMETLALALLSTAVLAAAEMDRLPPLALGALVGLGVWLRPDALLLGLPIGIMILADSRRRRGEKARRILLASLGAAVLFLPYLAFNQTLSGEWWPSTFFAKQAEYAELRAEPLLTRLTLQFRAPLTGAGIVLAAGVVLSAYYSVRERRPERLAPLLWVAVFLGAYALRLPVNYQHGRYAMPVVPVLIVFGLEGMARWCRLRSPSLGRRLVSRVWVLTLAVTAALFWVLGGRAYGRDVAIIETEMVRAARWVRENTPPDALIAAHDIGALGYYADRRLVDLAGLVTPEVIPILRDEAALAVYLEERGADYLVTFPSWYPALTRGLSPVFTTDAPFAPAAGADNMAIYLWRSRSFAPREMAVLYSEQSCDGRDDHGNYRRHYR